MGAVAVGPYKGNFDLTMISHVEPLDFGATPTRPTTSATTPRPTATCSPPTTAPPTKERTRLLGDMQRQLATDAVNAIFSSCRSSRSANKQLKGLWSSSPIFANDMAAVSWQ
jgi:peptide/nickel transport system substrate-binding protein